MKRLLIAVILGLAPAARPALAQNSQVGTSGAQFLKIGAGARAAALAEAYSAIADDPYALYYNPAGITRLAEPQVAAAHTSYFQGMSYEVAAFAYPLPSGREAGHSSDVLGLSIYNLSISDIERRTGDSPQPVGTFGAGDYSYNLSYAHRLDARLSLGATGKLIHQTLDTYSSTAFALDAGAQFTPRPEAARPLTLAAVLKNAGTRAKYAGSESDPLPLGVAFGAGKEVLENLTADIDLTKYRDTGLYVSAGAEYRRKFADDLTGAFRLGYSSVRQSQDGLNGIALGAGVRFYRAAFDFAWVPFGDLGNTFRYSLEIRFSGGSGGAAAQAAPALGRAEPPPAAKTEADPQAWLDKAADELARQRNAEARAALKRALDVLPSGDRREIDAYSLLGLANLREGRVPEAREAYVRSLQAAKLNQSSPPAVSDSYYGLGLCLVKEGNLPYARKFFLKALEGSPTPQTVEDVRSELEKLPEP